MLCCLLACLFACLLACLFLHCCLYSYDFEEDVLRETMEGVTHLVEHPTQMQPPGKSSLFCSLSTPHPNKHSCELGSQVRSRGCTISKILNPLRWGSNPMRGSFSTEGCWFTPRNKLVLQLWNLTAIYNQTWLKNGVKHQFASPHLIISKSYKWYRLFTIKLKSC